MGDRPSPPDSDAAGSWTPRLIAVVAATPDNVIGLDGGMPWRLRSDLQRFKRGTMGGVLLMGRKTFDSIGRPLPGRTTVVVTRQKDWSSDGITVVSSDSAQGSIQEAIETSYRIASEKSGNIHVVGGAEIYRQTLDRCDEIWLTDVWSAVDGDTRLEIDRTGWRCVESIRQPAGPHDSVPTQWNRLVRR